jgi:hypothetical protein
MSSNHFAEQKVVIDFPIAKVKEAINSILAQKSTKYPHKKENLNEIMGTYQFFELGINSLQFNLSLSEVSESKTELNFRVTPDITSKANSAMCAQGISTFQGHISNTLTGQPLAASSGCAILVIVGIGATMAMMFF